MNVIKVIAEHIGLASSEPQKLAKWYENVFGLCKEQKGPSDKGPYFLTESETGFIIEVFFKKKL